MSAPDPDRAQRDAADGGASVWVAASAGTGKTKVLTDRVLALMLAGSEPARILCLTFTKAAAAEMANRLNERLSLWTTIGDGALDEELAKLTRAMPDQAMRDRARRLFARVLDAPGGMKIETIHAFCQSLLRRFPLEAGIAPHFELMDERSAGEALELAREEVLAAARSGAAPELREALVTVTRYVPETGFGELMSVLALERSRLAAAMSDGGEQFAAAIAGHLGLAPGETAARILAVACMGGACDEHGLRAAASALLEGSTTDKTAGERIAAWLAAPDQRVAGFDEYCLAYFTKEGERRKNLASKSVAPHAPPTLEAEAARLAGIRARRAAALLAEASSALVAVGTALLAAYDRHKEARALIDYDDLVLKARDLLRRPGIAPWVLFKLDGGLDHILIDEAQDTNPEQWEVIAALAEEFFSGDGARAPGRTIFAVGDAKQSIYSFQRADPREFLRMRQHFSGRVAAARGRWRNLDLSISFRSTAPVLATIDKVFAASAARDGVALDDAPILHRAQRDGAAGLVELWPAVEPIEPEDAKPWEEPLMQHQGGAPRLRLARAIAAQIRSWLEKGERLPARDRRLRAGDIMVLVRRRGPFVGELVRALKQLDVAVAGVDRMRLTEQLAIEDMLALAQFLLLPEDDLTLATVLKGPLFGFDEERLFVLAHDRDGTLWSALRQRAGGDPLFARAEAELGQLMARADFMPPYELFAEILGARGGRRAMLARLGQEAADPLDELLAAALAYERMHGSSLQGFLHWLAIGEAEVKRDLEQRQQDEVRILTVHGAKGLQAPIVFLPDTMQVPDQPQRLVWSDGLPLWLAERSGEVPAAALARMGAAQLREQEYRRLLYVAMTRAEDRLYVCGWRMKRAPHAGCWYGLVEAGLKAAGAETTEMDFHPLMGEEGWAGKGLRLASVQSAKPRLDALAAAAAASAEELPVWATAPPPREPTPPRPLAPSQPDLPSPPARSPLGGDGGAGFRRGRLLHRLLQSLPELAPDAREAAARRFLGRSLHGLSPEEQEALLGEAMAVLDDPDFAPLFGPGSLAEVPVVGLVAGRALAGQIDRLVVREDRVLIVDYKTMRPPPKSEAEVPELYLDQLAAYRAAIAEIYPGRAVRCALLWTDGPRLMPVSEERLASRLPGPDGAPDPVS